VAQNSTSYLTKEQKRRISPDSVNVLLREVEEKGITNPLDLAGTLASNRMRQEKWEDHPTADDIQDLARRFSQSLGQVGPYMPPAVTSSASTPPVRGNASMLPPPTLPPLRTSTHARKGKKNRQKSSDADVSEVSDAPSLTRRLADQARREVRTHSNPLSAIPSSPFSPFSASSSPPASRIASSPESSPQTHHRTNFIPHHQGSGESQSSLVSVESPAVSNLPNAFFSLSRLRSTSPVRASSPTNTELFDSFMEPNIRFATPFNPEPTIATTQTASTSSHSHSRRPTTQAGAMSSSSMRSPSTSSLSVDQQIDQAAFREGAQFSSQEKKTALKAVVNIIKQNSTLLNTDLRQKDVSLPNGASVKLATVLEWARSVGLDNFISRVKEEQKIIEERRIEEASLGGSY
jgi:hypothetical protein